jgi:imidazoleglycerol phosphate synthase glutamine amidotransferase subunit HisH
VLGQVVFVLHRNGADKLVFPEIGAAASFVEQVNRITVFGTVIDDEAALVDFLGVNALLGGQSQVAVVFRNL